MSQKSLRGTHFEAATARFEFSRRILFLPFSVTFACRNPQIDLRSCGPRFGDLRLSEFRNAFADGKIC